MRLPRRMQGLHVCASSNAYMSEHSLAVLVFLRLIRSTLTHVVVVCALVAHPLAGKMLPQPHSTSKYPLSQKNFIFFSRDRFSFRIPELVGEHKQKNVEFQFYISFFSFFFF